MIQVNNLQKTFLKDGHRIEVLRGLDFEIADGESLAVVGASGLFDGVNVFTWPEKRLAAFRNRKIGFVFQFHNLLPEFTALENAMMPALIQRMPKAEARRRAEAILDEVGLSNRITHKPGELSGGEQQRVALARSLILEPEILLADEPTGNLDTETGKKIEDMLIALNRTKRITLIVVTHNPLLAGRMSQHIGLRDGRIYTRE
jgi:lipoprotein-releasing system ATP-binding protein